MHNNLIMDAILWSTHMIKLFFHLYLTLKFEHKDGLGPLEQSRKMKKKKLVSTWTKLYTVRGYHRLRS